MCPNHLFTREQHLTTKINSVCVWKRLQRANVIYALGTVTLISFEGDAWRYPLAFSDRQAMEEERLRENKQIKVESGCRRRERVDSGIQPAKGRNHTAAPKARPQKPRTPHAPLES